ncbi:MAG: UDP-N-acetylmuramoyl-L-alanyl-D-glutamate--2,6-diaminopimelate ligase [Clostridiales bacterium]|nr:UDP-N-acetylmuramoyl-L-alanyl-D-glutamate--2,6-diaminopimelate ligase [Clostridiales bacterium]
MNLYKILENIDILEFVNINKEETKNIEIKNICDNTTNIKKLKDSLFVCIEGFNFDSHTIVKDFESFGVKFLVCNKKIETKIPCIIVKNTRKVLGEIASNFYDNPCKKLKIIGVIGTNGKTSTTYIIKQLLDKQNVKTSLIGTSGVYINNKRIKETLTTPDPLLLNELFYKMFKAGSEVVVMEISAHAISLNKVDFLCCDALIFSNFSQDHLDFFQTMENYKNTKFSFFNSKNCKNAIINIDDKAGSELYANSNEKIPTFSFGIENDADIIAKDIKLFLNKTNLTIKINESYKKIAFNLSCRFNVYNLLSAVLTLKVLDFSINLNHIKTLKPIKGRFNIIKLSKNKFIIIDYAHTPESLKSLLQNVNKLFHGKIITLFGCPGNRDETKREIMGNIAYNYSDKIYITSDNPKYENPLIICNQILKGAKEKGKIVEDREKAIKKAIKNLKANEVLLIVGKGSESYQDINNLKIPYSDFKVVYKCIKKLKKQ